MSDPKENDDGERLARVETAIESLADQVKDLVSSVRVLSKNQSQLGKTDWRAMAGWAAVVLTIMGGISAIAAREFNNTHKLISEHVSKGAHSGANARLGRIESSQVQSRAHIESQMAGLSYLLNIEKENNYRWLQVVSENPGIKIPPPRYFPTFGEDRPAMLHNVD